MFIFRSDAVHQFIRDLASLTVAPGKFFGLLEQLLYLIWTTVPGFVLTFVGYLIVYVLGLYN